MQMRLFPAVLLAASLFSCAAMAGAAGPRDTVVDETLAQLKAQYVFPDKYPAIEQSVRKHQDAGDYARAADDKAFAELLTTHLQEVTHDKHMNLKYQQNVRALRPAAFTSTPAQRARERRENYGFRALEVLPGNVGYLDISYFHDDPAISGDTIAAAMAFLANTDALIIDLRSNRGGGEAMQRLASYLTQGPVKLMELRYRDGRVVHALTDANVKGQRYLDKPVYVLTSGKTFSAGEAFAYAMQGLKRATLVGATTRGGGNPNTLVPVHADFILSIPIGESISPVTGTGWEGVGVKPDIAVDEKQALDVARRKALEAVRDTAKDEDARAGAAKALAALDKA